MLPGVQELPFLVCSTNSVNHNLNFSRRFLSWFLIADEKERFDNSISVSYSLPGKESRFKFRRCDCRGRPPYTAEFTQLQAGVRRKHNLVHMFHPKSSPVFSTSHHIEAYFRKLSDFQNHTSHMRSLNDQIYPIVYSKGRTKPGNNKESNGGNKDKTFSQTSCNFNMTTTSFSDYLYGDSRSAIKFMNHFMQNCLGLFLIHWRK